MGGRIGDPTVLELMRVDSNAPSTNHGGHHIVGGGGGGTGGVYNSGMQQNSFNRPGESNILGQST